MEIRFLTELHTKPVPRETKAPWLKKSTDKVALVTDFIVVVDGILITVGEGYVTDGSSIPRLLWMLYNPWYTEARKASCVHDFIYSHLYESLSKDFADKALRAIMLHEGAPVRTANIFYRAVKWFGRGGWK